MIHETPAPDRFVANDIHHTRGRLPAAPCERWLWPICLRELSGHNVPVNAECGKTVSGGGLDRLKDMIVTGGENLYSAEVEVVISSLPALPEVAVFGIPDPQWRNWPPHVSS